MYAEAAGEAPLHDPLRPAAYRVPTSEQPTMEQEKIWHLGAVLLSGSRSVAVLNGRPVQVGETLDGYRVVKIEPGKVLLSHKKQTVVVRRAGTGLKKISSSPGVEEGSRQ